MLTKKRSERKAKEEKRKKNPSDHHDGVITNLEPDILEWEVKWA